MIGIIIKIAKSIFLQNKYFTSLSVLNKFHSYVFFFLVANSYVFISHFLYFWESFNANLLFELLILFGELVVLFS